MVGNYQMLAIFIINNDCSHMNGFLSLSVEKMVACPLSIRPLVLSSKILSFSWTDYLASLGEATYLNFGQQDANSSHKGR